MTLIADLLLGAGALGAGYFCYVLSVRLTALNRLESGMGGAIAVLSVQVDDMTKAVSSAEQTARASAERLEELTARAEAAAQRLELLLASLHDLPEPGAPDAGARRARVIHRAARSRDLTQAA